ncbi:MAG: DinB family protein [Saprospiraceae bacterium]
MKKSIENQLNTLDSELRLLLRDLQKLSDKDLNWQPQPGKWSVVQVMMHLMKAEDMSIKYVQKKLSFEPKLKRAIFMGPLRGMMLSASLRTPFKAKAPAAVADDQFPKEAAFWDLVKQWKEQREELRVYLGTLPKDTFNKELYKHPLFGKMSLGAMLSFFINHFRRHRKQIDKILVNFKY